MQEQHASIGGNCHPDLIRDGHPPAPFEPFLGKEYLDVAL
jgi:hypothetical protein